MKIKTQRNEYGTLTSYHICDTCGAEFTVTPAACGSGYDNCLDEECPSYDPSRDIDAAFDSESEIKERKVVSIKALKLRREINHGN